MSEQESQQRAAVVREAESWLGTPYHHRAWIKGAGVDCAMLLKQSFVNAGLVEDFEVGNYPPDWMLHRGEEIFLGIVTRYCREVPAPTGPGDIMLCRVARLYAHGCLIVAWPRVIHAFRDSRAVVYADALPGGSLMRSRPRFFSYWGRA